MGQGKNDECVEDVVYPEKRTGKEITKELCPVRIGTFSDIFLQHAERTSRGRFISKVSILRSPFIPIDSFVSLTDK